MLHPNPAVEPKLQPAASRKLLDNPLEGDCTYVPELPLWDESFELQFTPAEYPNEPLTSYEEKYLKRYRRKMALAKFAVGVGLFAGAHAAMYLSDVQSNMAEATEAKPTIRIMSEAVDEDSSHKATIFYHGFNSFGASDLVSWLGDGAKQAYSGEQWAVQYNNAPLDAAKISETINDQIEERGITSVDVVTYSMGDVPGIDNAVEIINNGWVNVESITILSGPADYDGLTEKTQEELAIAKSFAWIPWVEYSTPFRYLAEMYFYKDAIERNPVETVEGINTRFRNGDVTTNLFLSSQINSISDSNIGDKIGSIDPMKFQPTINYVKIKDGRDTVVDNDYSAEKICEYANEKGLNCNVFEVNSTHGNFFLNADEYAKVFEQIGQILKPQVEKEQARHALYLYGLTQTDDIDPRKPR